MKKFVAAILVTAMAISMTGCGKQENNTTEKDTTGEVTTEEVKEESSYKDSLEILSLAWENVPEDSKFACYGGTIENSVSNGPGALDVSDTESLKNIYLVPEGILPNVSDAASLVHMMNANTFTGVVLHVKDLNISDTTRQIKDSVMGNQFMCGFPEKLVIITTGDYIIYAFGATDLIDNFKDSVCANVEGANVSDDVPMGE